MNFSFINGAFCLCINVLHYLIIKILERLGMTIDCGK